MRFKHFTVIQILIFFLLFSDHTSAQYSASIRSIQTQTKHGVVIKISTVKDSYKLGETIVIDYTVSNEAGKPVYLVLDSELEISSYEENLWIRFPVKFPAEHKSYNYEFIKILPKDNYKGKVMLESRQIPIDKDYDKQTWKIQVGFAFLFDITGLYKGKIKMGAEEYLGQVFERSLTADVGSLVVEIDN